MQTRHRSDRVRLQRRRRLAQLLAAAPAVLLAACTTAEVARLPPDGHAGGTTAQAPASNPTGSGNEELAQTWRNY
jgi:hypothetical protein